MVYLEVRTLFVMKGSVGGEWRMIERGLGTSDSMNVSLRGVFLNSLWVGLAF